MKNAKKIVSIILLTAMLCTLPGAGMFGSMVAWAFETTVTEEVVTEEVVEEVVYETEIVEEIVYETEIVEEVVYETEIVEEIVEETEVVEGHVYFEGISADVFALVIDEKTASVFGEIKENDVEPIIRNDRTMLPARFVAENLGAAVEWDADARVVTVKNEEVEIKLTIDSTVATVNGVEETLDSPAIIENDRTYTPVRFIAEKLGATVNWDDELKMVLITTAVEEVVEEVTEEIVEVTEEVTEEIVEVTEEIVEVTEEIVEIAEEVVEETTEEVAE